MKCGICGLTYIGAAANRPNGKREFYYRCNGAHSPAVYGANGRCNGKAVRGDQLEEQVWSDVKAFLYNPEAVLQQLQARLESDAPEIRYLPAILRFLSYNPLPAANGWGERLVRQRTTLGLPQKEAAKHLGVDPSTLARWERGEREPTGALLERLQLFLQGGSTPRWAA